jgi:chromosome segregation ATPase
MSFKKPEEDDEGQTFEKGGSPSGGSGSITEETVEFGDEEVTVADALRLVGDTLTEPEEFGLVKAERVRELENRLGELRAENDDLRKELQELRSDMGGLWKAASEVDEQGRHYVRLDSDTGWLPESVDPYDPAGDFDE